MVTADEVVGVVLSHAEARGVAQIDLDYVTPKFRDFTPGEFVYRRSHLFTERGFHRVVSPPRMVAPYYHRLGFRPEGDSYVLDLPAVAGRRVGPDHIAHRGRIPGRRRRAKTRLRRAGLRPAVPAYRPAPPEGANRACRATGANWPWSESWS